VKVVRIKGEGQEAAMAGPPEKNAYLRANRTHTLGTYGHARPAKTSFRTAVTGI
jgi:hypothetical protein